MYVDIHQNNDAFTVSKCILMTFQCVVSFKKSTKEEFVVARKKKMLFGCYSLKMKLSVLLLSGASKMDTSRKGVSVKEREGSNKRSG